MLTQSFLNRALIASGALWCVVGISAGLTRGNQNNAQLTCAESAKRHRSPRTLIASLRPVSAGASWRRGVMRPPAPVRSGAARGRVRSRRFGFRRAFAACLGWSWNRRLDMETIAAAGASLWRCHPKDRVSRARAARGCRAIPRRV